MRRCCCWGSNFKTKIHNKFAPPQCQNEDESNHTFNFVWIVYFLFINISVRVFHLTLGWISSAKFNIIKQGDVDENREQKIGLFSIFRNIVFPLFFLQLQPTVNEMRFPSGFFHSIAFIYIESIRSLQFLYIRF